MKKFIVTTTINKPTEATLKFCKIAKEKNWTFVIVGDTKTPHDEYKALENSNVVYLTPEEQESLYKDVQKVPKWADAEFFDIEEDIAEDFRSFMKSEKFKESLPGFLRNIFERIGAFLRWAYGKITRQDMTRPRDIPRVREMFEVLRTNKPEEAIKKGLFQSLNATTQNISFTKLNRGKKIGRAHV